MRGGVGGEREDAGRVGLDWIEREATRIFFARDFFSAVCPLDRCPSFLLCFFFGRGERVKSGEERVGRDGMDAAARSGRFWQWRRRDAALSALLTFE